MIALAFFAALCAAPVQDVRASASCTPRAVEIGEPIECALAVEHPADVSVRIKADELALDDSWLVLEGARVLTTSSPQGSLTRARWLVASLEPGERGLALPPARYEADGILRTAVAEPALVTVRAALAAGEDAPRPAEGFRPPPADPTLRVPRLWVLGVVAAFVAAGFTLFVARSRRGRAPVVEAPGPLEPFERWKSIALDDPTRLRALFFELSQALRAAADRRMPSSAPRAGLTDDEWLARAAEAPGVSREMHEELAALLALCARVKYGQELPTRWAADETLARGRALAERLVASDSTAATEARP